MLGELVPGLFDMARGILRAQLQRAGRFVEPAYELRGGLFETASDCIGAAGETISEGGAGFAEMRDDPGAHLVDDF